MKKITVISIIALICISCEKNEFKDIYFKATYEYDGEWRSFTEQAISFYPDSHTLNITHRNDTTFFFSPHHIWWDGHFFYGYLNIVDEINPSLPENKTEYLFKSGLIYPETADSRKVFTENIIFIYPAPRKTIEILDGHCTIEKVWRTLKLGHKSFVGVKISFEAKWQEVESGEDHEVKNGEVWFSSDIVNIDNRDYDI